MKWLKLIILTYCLDINDNNVIMLNVKEMLNKFSDWILSKEALFGDGYHFKKKANNISAPLKKCGGGTKDQVKLIHLKDPLCIVLKWVYILVYCSHSSYAERWLINSIGNKLKASHPCQTQRKSSSIRNQYADSLQSHHSS